MGMEGMGIWIPFFLVEGQGCQGRAISSDWEVEGE
jgi:hypothetical protein